MNIQVTLVNRSVTTVIAVCFLLQTCQPAAFAASSNPGLSSLPHNVLQPSEAYQLPVICGIKVYPKNGLRFDFIVDPGSAVFSEQALRTETAKLVQYFLTALTARDEEMWVNLSPFEENRIIPKTLERTEMGRVMLEQDALLKRLTASLMHPESDVGKEFWERVYQKCFFSSVKR